ncbi:DUF6234 family protein [Streptomyces sp. NPDC056452]|uniref:DUF6234 family protein n=1 Tax=Streptomyces sp. NPDC056452 TaxID=3345821 RepID=UPI003691B891
MLTWVADAVLAVLLTALEVAALVALWFVEGLKRWAAGGKPVAGSEFRLWLVLTAGPAGLGGVSYGAVRAGLPATAATQALVAAALAGVLVLGIGTEYSRWAARSFRRHRAGRRNRRAKTL